MSVVGLHPEQLIDKLEAGTLSNAERAQLDAHLLVCLACRMELATRADLAQDPPLAFPERPELTLRAPEPEAPPARLLSTPAARRSRRLRLTLFVAAATLSASGALAALSNRQSSWRIWFRDPAPTVNGPAASSSASSKGIGRRKSLAAVAAASNSVASSELPVVADTSALPSTESGTAPSSAVAEAQPALAERRARAARALGLASPNEESSAAAASSAAAIPSGLAKFPLLASGTAESAASSAASLFAEASRARRDGNTGRALKLYRQLQRDYPSSPEGQISVALSAKIMLDRGDAAAAATDYDRYLQEGTPVLSAEALVGRARAIEQLGQLDAAVAAWREVQERFPGSVHARLAAARLAALGAR
jgi:TolA-binding protein